MPAASLRLRRALLSHIIHPHSSRLLFLSCSLRFAPAFPAGRFTPLSLLPHRSQAGNLAQRVASWIEHCSADVVAHSGTLLECATALQAGPAASVGLAELGAAVRGAIASADGAASAAAWASAAAATLPLDPPPHRPLNHSMFASPSEWAIQNAAPSIPKNPST